MFWLCCERASSVTRLPEVTEVRRTRTARTLRHWTTRGHLQILARARRRAGTALVPPVAFAILLQRKTLVSARPREYERDAQLTILTSLRWRNEEISLRSNGMERWTHSSSSSTTRSFRLMFGLNLVPLAVDGPAVASLLNSLVLPSKPPTGLSLPPASPIDGVRARPTEGARVEPTPTEGTRLTDARR